jgi:hypothetical protein
MREGLMADPFVLNIYHRFARVPVFDALPGEHDCQTDPGDQADGKGLPTPRFSLMGSSTVYATRSFGDVAEAPQLKRYVALALHHRWPIRTQSGG